MYFYRYLIGLPLNPIDANLGIKQDAINLVKFHSFKEVEPEEIFSVSIKSRIHKY